MKQRRFILGSVLLAATVAACGSDPNGDVVGLGPDGGPVGVLPDGAVVPYDGGTPNTLDGGAVVIPPNSDTFFVDRTGGSGVAPATVDALRTAATAAGAGAGGANGGLNPNPSNCTDLMYPYEGTIMPGGLISPPFMFQSGWDAVYVRAGYTNSDRLDYQFAAGATNPGELRIPAEDWGQIIARNQATAMTLTFAFQRGGATATCISRMTFANGNMTGSIYYNTYNHPDTAGTGAVLRLPLGQPTAELYLRDFGVQPVGPCLSCHSVSADGSTLAASTHLYGFPSMVAKSYTVGTAPQPPGRADVKDAAFGGLTPDGTAIFRMGNPDCTAGANAFPRAQNNFPLAIGPTEPGLIDTTTGNAIPSTGLVDGHFYWMPQFSPDGRKMVFNNAHLVNGLQERRELAVVDYDPATHTFSAPRVLVSAGQLPGVSSPSRDYNPAPIAIAAALGAPGTDLCSNPWSGDDGRVGRIVGGSCDGPCYPGWPFFTPDGKGVIFAMISEPDFTVAFPGRDTASKSELWYADVATGQAVRLDKANQSPGSDGEINYYPTVLPVQVGGYYWLFWTSTRAFGHRSLAAPPDAILSAALFGGNAAADAFKKRIWVSAIIPPGGGEFAGGTLTDPSTPPFYLEGQGNTGNTRAFAALNPCKQDSSDCQSGLDCCSGYCNFDDVTKKGVCGPKITCAKINEKCDTNADCCPPTVPGDAAPTCIGGYCGFLLR